MRLIIANCGYMRFLCRMYQEKIKDLRKQLEELKEGLCISPLSCYLLFCEIVKWKFMFFISKV